MFIFSARQKLDLDLSELDRQIKLQQGQKVSKEFERPAQAYLDTPMVGIF